MLFSVREGSVRQLAETGFFGDALEGGLASALFARDGRGGEIEAGKVAVGAEAAYAAREGHFLKVDLTSGRVRRHAALIVIVVLFEEMHARAEQATPDEPLVQLVPLEALFDLESDLFAFVTAVVQGRVRDGRRRRRRRLLVCCSGGVLRRATLLFDHRGRNDLASGDAGRAAASVL